MLKRNPPPTYRASTLESRGWRAVAVALSCMVRSPNSVPSKSSMTSAYLQHFFILLVQDLFELAVDDLLAGCNGPGALWSNHWWWCCLPKSKVACRDLRWKGKASWLVKNYVGWTNYGSLLPQNIGREWTVSSLCHETVLLSSPQLPDCPYKRHSITFEVPKLDTPIFEHGVPRT